jgi:Leucine-rich repeat (LRR) protein
VLPVLSGVTLFIPDYGPPELPSCLDDLASFPRLRALHLHADQPVLPPLPPQLQELTFRSWQAKQIDSISTLTSLKTLDLSCYCALAALTPVLDACTTLEVLRIIQCSVLTAWPDLAALKSLRELRIAFSPGLRDWSFLAALTALTRLHLSGVSINVEVLADLTQLQDLALSYLAKGEDEDGDDWQGRLSSSLASLVGLVKLDVSNNALDLLQFCSALNSLRSLHAGGNALKTLDLDSCPQLTELDLRCSHLLTSLHGLHGMPRLSKLSLEECTLISSFDFHSCPNLSELDLRGNARLTSLSGLQGLQSLAVLSLRGCAALESLEPLSKCQMLARLNLSDCTSILSLEPLRSCPNLTELDLSGCSLISPPARPLCSLLELLNVWGHKAPKLPGLEYLRGLPGLVISDR